MEKITPEEIAQLRQYTHDEPDVDLTSIRRPAAVVIRYAAQQDPGQFDTLKPISFDTDTNDSLLFTRYNAERLKQIDDAIGLYERDHIQEAKDIQEGIDAAQIGSLAGIMAKQVSDMNGFELAVLMGYINT